MKKLTWNDAEDIGLALAGKFPEVNPIELRFTDLHQRVIDLNDFADEPAKSNEAKLEAIQMAWYEEWKDSQS